MENNITIRLPTGGFIHLQKELQVCELNRYLDARYKLKWVPR